MSRPIEEIEAMHEFRRNCPVHPDYYRDVGNAFLAGIDWARANDKPTAAGMPQIRIANGFTADIWCQFDTEGREE